MKYRVFCETENKYIEIENLLIIEKCPNSEEHIVTSGSLSIIDSNYSSSKDYRRLRHELMEYVTNNYSSMSNEELKQAASHFCAPQDIINQFYTPSEQIALGKEFHTEATKCRKDRFDGVVSALFNHLEYEETGTIIQELDNYIWKYVDLGVEGTTEQDPEGVFDYFTSTSGTSFEDNGFMETGYEPRHTITLSGLRDFVMDILQNGCYIANENYAITYSGN